MSDEHAEIRSYQRIFKPKRRIYQVDGKRLPVPGGVPLSWLGYACGALVVVLILSARSAALTLAGAGAAALAGAELRGFRGAFLAGLLAALAIQLAGLLLGLLDWPLRLLVLPCLVATAASELTPDGRKAHRYLISRAALWLRPTRRSLDRPLASDGDPERFAPRLWVAPDHHSPVLHHGRVHGPARVCFAEPVVLCPRRGRFLARPAASHRVRDGERVAQIVELADGQVLEVRP